MFLQKASTSPSAYTALAFDLVSNSTCAGIDEATTGLPQARVALIAEGPPDRRKTSLTEPHKFALIRLPLLYKLGSNISKTIA